MTVYSPHMSISRDFGVNRSSEKATLKSAVLQGVAELPQNNVKTFLRASTTTLQKNTITVCSPLLVH